MPSRAADETAQVAGEALQAAAYAATSEITVTEALAMRREPVTDALQNCPKPGGPAIARDEPVPVPAPSIEIDEALAPPIPMAALEQALNPPAPSTAAELDAPAPAVTPDQPIEAPIPIVAHDQTLAPPALVIAAELDAPAPAVTPDQPIEAPIPIVAHDQALAPPTPVIAAELDAPTPRVTAERSFDQAPAPSIARDEALAPPAPVIARALDAPAPWLTAERPIDQAPAPSIAQDEALPAPAPVIATALPVPLHIERERRLKDAEAFEKEKRAAAERAAHDRLTANVTADTLEAAGESLIRSHAGDASAYAHIAGVPIKTSDAAIKELRAHVKPFLVRDRDRRLPGRGFTFRDEQRNREAVKQKISDWRSWWRGGWLRAGAAARIVPAMVRKLWPTHWAETEAENEHVRKLVEEKAARTRRQREQGLARPRIVEAPQRDRDNYRGPGSGQSGGGPGFGI